MARISTYSTDTSLQKNDRLLGSNANGATRNFTIEDLGEFQASINASAIIGQIPYIYHNNTFGGNATRQDGSITTNTSNTSTNFSAINTVKVSKKPYGGENTIVNVINTFVNKEIIIAGQEDQDNFGVYVCTDVAQDISETDFYDVSITYIKGNGVIETNKFYSIVLYSGAQDKDFKHNQTSASSTWVITHNLNKYPNVVVFDSADNQAFGAVEFNSKNQLTITFSASFSGVAHLN